MRKNNNSFLVVGYYGFGNLGDELILGEIVKAIRLGHPGARIVAVSGDIDGTERQHRIEAVGVGDIHGLAEAVGSVDLVVIGGGGLFHDYWGVANEDVLSVAQRGIGLVASIALLASLYGKPLHIFSVGVGPLSTEDGKALTRQIFAQSEFSSVRDEQSVTVLEQIGVPTEGVIRSVDPALKPLGGRLNGHAKAAQVLVAVREWPFVSDWKEPLAGVLDDFIEVTGCTLRFVPFQVRNEELLDDREVASKLIRLMKHRENVDSVDAPLQMEDVHSLFSEADLVLGMRLHSVILAAQVGVPFVALGYDDKVVSFVKDLGLESQLVRLESLTGKSGQKRLATLLQSTWDKKHALGESIRLAADDLVARYGARDSRAFHPGSGSAPDVSAESTLEIWLQVLASLREARSTLIDQVTNLQDALRLQRTESEELSARFETERTDLLSELEREEKRREDLRWEKENLEEEVSSLSGQIAGMEQANQNLTSSLELALSNLRMKQTDLEEAEEWNKRVSGELDLIKSSRGYRLLGQAWTIRKWIVPNGSRREGAIKALLSLPRRIKATVASRSTRVSFTSLKRKFRYGLPFFRFRRTRAQGHARDFRRLTTLGQPGLVSVVMPVFNGEAFLAEAIESVLAQTHERFELIIVDDGSQDSSPEIIEKYRQADDRIMALVQENRTLPVALTEGFKRARGEFLTWTSHDNRLKPDFFENMVEALLGKPELDVVYANMDLIDDKGQAFRDCSLFQGYQDPPQSEHVYLPKGKLDAYVLNTWPNNFIGGAFMYRDRVPLLLGEYSQFQFTREDYDFWMRTNAVFNIGHIRDQAPLYDYRVHQDSLTSRDQELGITRDRDQLMVFEDFRRDFLNNAAIWIIESDGSPAAIQIADRLKDMVAETGQIDRSQTGAEDLVESPYLPIAYVMVGDPGGKRDKGPLPHVPDWAVRALVLPANIPTNTVSNEWDICLSKSSDAELPSGESPLRWGLSSEDKTLFSAIDVKLKSEFLRRLEGRAFTNEEAELKATVIVCTYRRHQSLLETLDSIARQRFPREDFEIIVVDNDPQDGGLEWVVSTHVRAEPIFDDLSIRVVRCPIPGLANARNVGLSLSRGAISVFVDDDATLDEDALKEFGTAFESNPEMGVIGGHIYLDTPAVDGIWTEAWKPYWSHFVTDYVQLTEVTHWSGFPWGANWAARTKALLRVGGFRSAYGRTGPDFNGGEEIVAAHQVRQIGYKVAVLPQAKAQHRVEKGRISLKNLKKTIKAAKVVHHRAIHSLHIEDNSEAIKDLTPAEKLARRREIDSGTNPLTAAKIIEGFYRFLGELEILRLRLLVFLDYLLMIVTKRV